MGDPRSARDHPHRAAGRGTRPDRARGTDDGRTPLTRPALVFLGNLIGAFDHWPVVVGLAITLGCAYAIALPRYETAGHIHGPRLEHVPELSAAGEAAVVEGELTPEILELLVLQHHTGERRISWCADVLGTDPAEIRNRITRGRRWLEIPATEVHAPATAAWVRLTTHGREAIGYA